MYIPHGSQHYNFKDANFEKKPNEIQTFFPSVASSHVEVEHAEYPIYRKPENVPIITGHVFVQESIKHVMSTTYYTI